MSLVNEDARREYHRKYYAANRGTEIQRARDHYARNREACNARSARYQANNRDKVRAANKQWQGSHPDRLMLARAKNRAKRNGLAFNITATDVSIPATCPVLGIALKPGSRDAAPSIDRIDNARGYVPGNVIVVSWRANRLKGDATIQELRRLADFYSAQGTIT